MDLVLLSCPPQSRGLEKRGHLEWDLVFFLVGPFGHWAGSGSGQDLEFSAVCLPSRPAWVSLCLLGPYPAWSTGLDQASPCSSWLLATSLQHLSSSSSCVSAHASEIVGVNRPLGTNEVLAGERWRTGSSGP